MTQKFPRIFTDDLLRPLATNYYPETLRRPDLLTHLADPVGQKCQTKASHFLGPWRTTFPLQDLILGSVIRHTLEWQ